MHGKNIGLTLLWGGCQVREELFFMCFIGF
jgi:hypothetical protein